mmetsp:Transcript_20250/g.54064  ORF Transcript_20250/g.54064 Transcript_20250/m.54064 type:complete len:81 (+) Transcript_20250:774-1016(+)|eukprot:CAMPEP_0194552374 /NCGR_PEP_ID=MMETSP0253-20130528/96694_1 /TAXON_ID=2966 /ORGANISM="Noctiluca scintillans" /LENGTH=80 /DNA_ID=CAMNT_0039399843 /DNA_START=727 /DNA_END=969 /DNA_ORIENTATION=+
MDHRRDAYRVGVQDAHESKDIHEDEVTVVAHADAVSHERAVVVHAQDAAVADPAVMSSGRLPEVTVPAEVRSIPDSQVAW